MVRPGATCLRRLQNIIARECDNLIDLCLGEHRFGSAGFTVVTLGTARRTSCLDRVIPCRPYILTAADHFLDDLKP